MAGAFFLDKSDPGSWRALNGLALKVAAAAEAAGLGRWVVELLNVRISQLNGCAYCLDLHDRLAREVGVSAQQLAVLPAWRETDVFDETERAALAVGEAASALDDDGESFAELAAARAVLTEAQYSALQWCAIAMNAFNRVSILSGHPVRPRPAAGTTGDQTEAASQTPAGVMP
ncbi:carboxymuconolactone decarboxylase family protein [Arthrobacter sp. ISL-65]|uniref:carboxymuconolactone decarboxylase family protein n=1 Tax=Arthrobacter sp. ISL-65 TaxID=2819112 RepID=UPI001BE7426A|nr:carboxymuconolactone decarboxylase family protein [Arthrobacter sp. ISL-65]MBT2548844.1 carboxymuconolactone decarboxylase family protein [Arthrobacter sp. ISL-65]